MTDLTEAKNLYLRQFERLEKEFAENGQARLLPIRKEALSHFARVGFPTARHEDWKYTNIAAIAETPFKPAGHETPGLMRDALAGISFGALAASQLVFINGHYSPELSSLRPLPEGVRAGSLAAALSAHPEWMESRLARYANYKEHPFVALNTAFMRDGAFLYVPEGKVIEEPLSLLFVSTAAEEPTVSYPRNLVLAAEDSKVEIVESYVGVGGGRYFTNAVTELVAGDNAVVDHYRLQRETEEAFHIATLQAHLGRSSNFTSYNVALGGALARNEIDVLLDGEGAECALNGLYVAAGRQHMDNRTRVDHLKPHCMSRQLYKGVLDGRARGVFNGRIVVHKLAEKTDARQTNNNLLLSEGALVDTKPQLEIHNNDVKCTHGSTIGQLDQDAIFYLRSRGVGLETARWLLTQGFAGDVINRMKIIKLREELSHFLMARFQQSLKESP